MELPKTEGELRPSIFKSYSRLRQEIQEKEREDEKTAETELRSNLVKKINVVLNRMAAQEKPADFVEFPNLGPLNDAKITARLNKVVAELKTELEKGEWAVEDKTGGFTIKRK